MMGDFLHNFTDGLSIGVAYQANFKLGLTTTVAMFFHEIPHEVGDFALLYQLNYNLCQIVGLQVLTSLGAMIGTLTGSYLGNIYMQECLAFTSGGFLYFAINGLTWQNAINPSTPPPRITNATLVLHNDLGTMQAPPVDALTGQAIPTRLAGQEGTELLLPPYADFLVVHASFSQPVVPR